MMAVQVQGEVTHAAGMHFVPVSLPTITGRDNWFGAQCMVSDPRSRVLGVWKPYCELALAGAALSGGRVGPKT